MKKIIAIGESLIDFIPSDKINKIENISSFYPRVGGAPLNVLGAIAKLGGETLFYSTVGYDPFGLKIINYLKSNNINTSKIYIDKLAKTSLAFVSYVSNDRDFYFSSLKPSYAKYPLNMIKVSDFKDTYAIHFCSVALKDKSMRKAHYKALSLANKLNVLVSFDLNLRLNLYESKDLLKELVFEYMKYADIIKISDDEFKFLFNSKDVISSLRKLLNERTKLILYTAGQNGSMAITKNEVVKVPALKIVDIVDTTGAGDAFSGSFLYQLNVNNVKDLVNLTKEELTKYLSFSNKYAGLSTKKSGCITSYLTIKEMNDFKF